MRSDTTPAGERDLAAILSDTRDRIADLFADQSDSSADAAVPTLRDATVRDVLVHLTGSAARVGLQLPSAQPDRSSSPGDLLAALSATEIRPADEVQLPLLIADAVMCEHDIRTALDSPGARDDVAIKVALDELAGRFSDRVAAAKLPPLRVTVEQWGTIVGDGRASACVVADRFEFVRAMSGRRSASEITRWNWGGDPAPYLAVIAEHELPTDEVRERDPRVPVHMRDREFVL